MTILYVIIAILFFGILVIIHEAGHFVAAKACGIRVEEFSVGFGPAIISRQKGETLYSWRAVPFGGFCAMTGEDGENEDPRAFTNQALWKKLIVLCAGSVMNFLLGLIIMLILTAGAKAFTAPVVAGFFDGCPYQGENALMQGDRIHRMNGKRVFLYSDFSQYLDEGNGSYDLVIIRDGKKIKLDGLKMEPIEYDGYEEKMFGFNMGYDEATFANKIKYAWYNTCDFVRWVWEGLEMLLTGKAGVNDLSGPVGIVDLMAETGEAAETRSDAAFNIAYLGAFIAVNLAVMNMLPIPAVDGGRVFLILVTFVIEKITKKKLNPKYETYINAVGLALLMALMAYVMFHDVVRLITGG